METQLVRLDRSVGAAILRRRQVMGMSQEKLAKRAGLNRSYISDIERGRRKISVNTFLRLAESLDISPSMLMLNAETIMGDLDENEIAAQS